MPHLHMGREYLNVGESAAHLNVSRTTFGEMRERYGLESKTFPGKGRSEFYLKAALDLIQQSSVEDIEEVKRKIAELQSPEPQSAE